MTPRGVDHPAPTVSATRKHEPPKSSLPSHLFLGAASVLLLAMFSSAAFAGVIYQYRQDGSPAVIGTLEVASPPASASIGWSTAASSDLIALFLDNAVFGLGSANLLSVGGTLPPEIQSLDGTTLEAEVLESTSRPSFQLIRLI